MLKQIYADAWRRYSPVLANAETGRVWSGRIGITVNRIPHFGRTDDDIYFVQGFSGHGVALTGLAGTILANAIRGDAEQFDVMRSLRHMPFPGGILRTPALALGMAWYKLRQAKTINRARDGQLVRMSRLFVWPEPPTSHRLQMPRL